MFPGVGESACTKERIIHPADKNGKEQAGVFELGKDIVRTTLTVLQVRTGKEVEYQDNEACKQFKTPKECEARVSSRLHGRLS